MEMSLHHVQLSGPPGCEGDARAFWVGVLGLTEVAKPEALRSRGGAWFRADGGLEVHVGIEADFRPAAKAHPGIAVADVETLSRAVSDAGRPVTWDENVPGLRRFHTTDPMGNRLEFQQRSASGGRA